MSGGTVNKVIIIGRLGADPEVRSTQAGKSVCTMSVATNETSGKGTDKKETTEWHRVIAWDQLAEICGEYLRKGRQVYIEGRIQTRRWEKDGQERYTTEIIAREVVFLGDKNSDKPADKPRTTRSATDENDGQNAGQPADNGDIPF